MNTVQKTLVGVGAAVVAVALPLGLWVGNVLWSSPSGAAGVYKQNNDSNNRIAANTTWQQGYNDVMRDVNNIKNVRSVYKDAAHDPQGFIVTAQIACNNSVTRYNGYQNQTLTKSWKPANLPTMFDDSTCQ